MGDFLLMWRVQQQQHLTKKQMAALDELLAALKPPDVWKLQFYRDNLRGAPSKKKPKL